MIGHSQKNKELIESKEELPVGRPATVALWDIKGLDLSSPVIHVPGQSHKPSDEIPATANLKRASVHFSSGKKAKTLLAFEQASCIGEVVNHAVAINKKRSIDHYSIEEDGYLFEYNVVGGKILLSNLSEAWPPLPLPPPPQVSLGMPVPSPASLPRRNKTKKIIPKNEAAFNQLIKWIENHQTAYLKIYNELERKEPPICRINILKSFYSVDFILRGLKSIFSSSTENVIALLDEKSMTIEKEAAVNYFQKAVNNNFYLKGHLLTVLLISEGHLLNQDLLGSLKSIYQAKRFAKAPRPESHGLPKKRRTPPVTIQKDPTLSQSAPTSETPPQTPATPCCVSVDMMENFPSDLPEDTAIADYNIDTFFNHESFLEETQPHPAKKNKQQDKGEKNSSTKLIMESFLPSHTITAETTSHDTAPPGIMTETVTAPHFDFAPSTQPTENPLEALQSHLDAYGLFSVPTSDTFSLFQSPSMIPKYGIK